MSDCRKSAHIVTVSFDERIPSHAQASALLHFEQDLRKVSGLDCRVVKGKMGDDSKLRMAMTPEEREAV